ncbi:hypothetical protein D3C81_1509940 [compost metagenome]
MVQRVAVGAAHVVHADGGDGLQARVDLGGADGEAAAAADADHADALAVDEGARAEEVHGGTEVFGVDVRRHGVARLARAFPPERQVQRQGDEALLGHLLRVEVGALLLHRAHRVADDDRRVAHLRVHVLGQVQVAGDLHAVLVGEADLLHGQLLALVEVVGIGRHLGTYGAEGADQQSHGE